MLSLAISTFQSLISLRTATKPSQRPGEAAREGWATHSFITSISRRLLGLDMAGAAGASRGKPRAGPGRDAAGNDGTCAVRLFGG
jgi:hypothetical protein